MYDIKQVRLGKGDSFCLALMALKFVGQLLARE